MSALQIWLRNHNRRLTQDAIDEALMEYITHVEKQRDDMLEVLKEAVDGMGGSYALWSPKAISVINSVKGISS